jgi:hypothetical protein
MKPRTAKEKELADNARLLRWWKTWHREQRDEALAKYPDLAELFRMFRNLKHVQPVQVLGLASSIDWSVVDYATKLTIVHEFNTRVTALREKRDLEPIDDPLPGEPESPFRQLKALLFPPNGAPTGAQPGSNKPHRSS